MKKLFGTDGIRELATNDIFKRGSLNILSKAILGNGKYKKIVLGRDTRKSSPIIEKIFVESLKNQGAHIYLLGLISTPALSYLTKRLNCDLGIIISASHNPYQFNGIKFFNKNGEKLSDKNEKIIENNFFKFNKNKIINLKTGKIINIKQSKSYYKTNVISTIKEEKLRNKKVVVDCANGSTYKLAKDIFTKFKIKAILINNKPNGININSKCGSLHPQNITKSVKKHSADFGISFDGDGDRIICCDEKGKIIDGDKILACLVKFYKERKIMKINGVVGTIMSNMGLENFVKNLGLNFYRSPVGDKFVYQLMLKKNCAIGGEQSGHIILREYSSSGDGILVALQLLFIISELKDKASKIFNLYKPYYQIQKNIKLKDSDKIKDTELKKLMNLYNEKLGNKGKVLIRASGTEPLIRIFLESKIISIINDLSKYILNSLKKKLRNN